MMNGSAVFWVLVELFFLGLTLVVIPTVVVRLWTSRNRWLSIYLAIIGLSIVIDQAVNAGSSILSLAQ